MSRAVVPVVFAVALVVVVWTVLHVLWYGHGQIVDYGVYQHYGDAIRGGAVPYRDVRIEYPPGALPVFLIPAWLEGLNYQRVFQVLMALCDIALVLAVWRIAGRRAALLAGLAPLALGSVVISRFDLWPAALTVWMLATLLRRNVGVSAVFMGTAFAAKLWPAVLAPFVLVWLLRNLGRRAALAWVSAAAAVAAAWFVPFAIAAPHGVIYSFRAQFARPLQLESLGGSILIALHRVAGTSLRTIDSFGSQNLAGPGTHALAVATAAAGVLALAVIWLLFFRAEPDDDDLVRYCAAAVAALLAFGKVFSPQFLIWLFPLVVLVRGRRASVALPLFGIALVLTQMWFPSHYWVLAQGFQSAQAAELLGRNLAVFALAVALAWPDRSQHQVLGEHRARIEALERVRPQVE